MCHCVYFSHTKEVPRNVQLHASALCKLPNIAFLVPVFYQLLPSKQRTKDNVGTAFKLLFRILKKNVPSISKQAEHFSLAYLHLLFGHVAVCGARSIPPHNFTLVLFNDYEHTKSKGPAFWRPPMVLQFIPYFVLRQVHSLFQREFSIQWDMVLFLSVSCILSLPSGYQVASYIFFFVFPSLLPFLQKRVLQGGSKVRLDQSRQPSTFSVSVGYSSLHNCT